MRSLQRFVILFPEDRIFSCTAGRSALFKNGMNLSCLTNYFCEISRVKVVNEVVKRLSVRRRCT